MKPAWLMIFGGLVILLAGLVGGSDGGGILPVVPDGDPLPSDGKQVLIVFEAADVFGYSQEQLAMIKGDGMASFLEEQCPGNWRRWDKDQETGNAPESFQRWMHEFNSLGVETPYLMVSDGETGKHCPLPATSEEAMQLIRKVLK